MTYSSMECPLREDQKQERDLASVFHTTLMITLGIEISDVFAFFSINCSPFISMRIEANNKKVVDRLIVL